MGQGQIRKGFFFYFGLFVLLLVAIFCICLVIMMFNPGKTVLWMQYFTANDQFVVSETTDESKTEINMNFIQNNIDTIKINCNSYAEVIVQRNHEDAYSKEGIYIINKAKGLQGANGAVHFDYSVTVTGKEMQITITEPNGFLYFSKEIKVVLTSYTEWENNFGHINLIVNTVDGDVSVGNTGLLPEDVELAGLTATTQKGDIILGDSFAVEKLNKLSLTTGSGRIISHNISTHSGKEYTGINVGCAASLATTNGRIDLGLVNVGANDLKVTCETGSVDVEFIKAANTNIACERGTFTFGTIDGNVSYAAGEDTMITPYVKADYITGNFLLQGYDKAEPEIYINRIDGMLQIYADKGKIDVNQAYGAVEIKSDDNLTADVIVAENNVSRIDIQTDSGEINVGFLGQFKNANLRNDEGKTIVKVVSGTKFKAVSYKNASGVQDSAQELLSVDKISVSIELLDDGYERNSFVVDGTDGTLIVYTNNNIEYKLVAKTDLVA